MSSHSSLARITVAVAVAAAMSVFAVVAHAAVEPAEVSCGKALGKATAKVSKTTLKEHGKCREADISGKTPGACPNMANTEKIDAAAAGAVSSAQKSCKSTCSKSSSVECIADALCPPIITITPSSGSPEKCSAGAKAIYFDMHSLGFPGPYCESTLGHSLTAPADIGQCVADLSEGASTDLIDAIYGSLGTSSVTPDALGCLKAISKSAQKLASTVIKGVAKCRDAINGGAAGDPANCQTSDQKLVDSIAKAEAKLDASIDAKCNPGTIAELDLCGNGVGATTTLADAKACIKAAAREAADSNEVPALRSYASVSVVDAAYPPRPVCGDNRIDQQPGAVLLLGEECDGTDDAACPGSCLPPGDLFECSCGNKHRMRLFNHAALTDSDAGWTGDSHQQGVADLSGYITEISNCDCDAFTDATCTGTSGDPVCDVHGNGLPTCSWDLFSATRCDSHGNVNNVDEDKDCYVCDEFSSNAGTFCKDERDCDAQCYDSGGTATGPCSNQSDCASGEICRGQCDRAQTCFIQPNGAPLPVAAASASVCAVQRLRTDVTGTRNIVTGQHETNYKLYSIIHLGDRNTRPCPVCGGFCEGGSKNHELCHGRCSGSGDSCRFDVDCPLGETCSSASPECPGGFCQLELVCEAEGVGAEDVANQPCTIEYEHALFGSMSNDCLPLGANITGQGFKVDHLPDTSGVVTVPFQVPCTAPGYELYDCPCRVCSGDVTTACTSNADCAAAGVGTCTASAGAGTKPNKCAPACNAVGPDFGVGCATGNTNGLGTTCAVGSVNVGKACDEDSDCPGSSCSVNPLHCTGDPAFAKFACTTNADCGVGTCGDACPGGRCVPLCVPTGDPLQGYCAAGPQIIHCTGGQYIATECSATAALAGCSATCSVSGGPCVKQTDCDPGETCSGVCPHATDCEAGPNGTVGDGDDIVGAGACEIFDRSCFLDPIVAEGGSTLGGGGDPTNEVSGVFWCFGPTTNVAVNTTSGFPGPGRVLSKGTNVTNGFTSIP